MKSRSVRSSLLLVLTAFIWGIAFVAQSKGGDAVGPFSFNAIRFLIGGVVLLPVIAILDRTKLQIRKPVTKADWKILLVGGLLCGIALCVAANLQQLGITFGANTAKAGFLTACYILLVPILGLFLKKKCGWNIWIGVALALVGLYFLCMKEGEAFGFQVQDILLLGCALVFSFQILLVDHYSPQVDPVRLSCIQFLVCGVLTMIPMFAIDIPKMGWSSWAASFTNMDAWLPILYSGILSSGVAYTLQVVAQPGLNPTVASLMMSLESVFAALAGWILLHQELSFRELMGCVLMFVAIVLAQLPLSKKANRKVEGIEEKKHQLEQEIEKIDEQEDQLRR